jgi:hypothetical protein
MEESELESELDGSAHDGSDVEFTVLVSILLALNIFKV